MQSTGFLENLRARSHAQMISVGQHDLTIHIILLELLQEDAFEGSLSSDRHEN